MAKQNKRPVNAKVRIRDVAQAAGVSMTTVSQILNGKGMRFSESTRERVLAIRDELGYIPDFNARNLITRSAKTIGVLVPNIGNPFFSTFIRGIEEEALKTDYVPVIFGSEHKYENEKHYIEALIKRTIDGLIIASPAIGQGDIDYLLERNHIPYLLIDQNPVNDGDRVETDDLMGVSLAMDHLLKLGHTKIALVTGTEATDNLQRRFQAYKAALQAHGLPFDEKLVIKTAFTKKGGCQAAKAVVNTPATAIFATNDELAIGLYRGLKDLGKIIPADYSIVGYDNIDLTEYLDPKLTTIEQPVFEMGKIAFQKLTERIKNPSLPPCEVLLPVKLIERQSTAPCEQAN